MKVKRSSMLQVCRNSAVAQLLPADALVSLLLLAIEQRAGSATIQALCSCRLGDKMLPDQAVGLILHALQCGNTAALQTLLRKKRYEMVAVLDRSRQHTAAAEGGSSCRPAA
jgi:hypothetical protein